MRTTVSIPDELFHRAEELARQLGTSRNRLYREALDEYLLRHAPHAARFDALAEELSAQPDPWMREVTRRMLERSEW